MHKSGPFQKCAGSLCPYSTASKKKTQRGEMPTATEKIELRVNRREVRERHSEIQPCAERVVSKELEIGDGDVL